MCLLVYLIIVLQVTSTTDTGDRLTCAGCIVLIGGCTLVERIAPKTTAFFLGWALVWGFYMQPAVLNRCHLTLWLVILGAFRNLIALESRATAAWRFATLTDVFRFSVVGL